MGVFAAVSSPKELVIHRLPTAKVNPEVLRRECEALCGQTKYKKYSRLEDAPYYTDCLTSISYLYKKAIGVEMRLDWIGNMPRKLVKKWGWVVEIIGSSELQTGDLIFLRNKGNRRLITHVALALSADQIFHSSLKRKGGRVERLSDIFSAYIQPINVESMLLYVDPRAVNKRESAERKESKK